MFERMHDQFQYESFAVLIHDLKRRYHRVHSGEIEGLHYEFIEQCTEERSGFLTVERLEAPEHGTPSQLETLVVEDNREAVNY